MVLKSIFFLLLLVCSFQQCICQDLKSESATGNHEADSAATLKTQRVINASLESFNEPVVCTLSDIPKGSKIKFEIKLVNRSGKVFAASSIKASCGCLAGLTEGVSIASGATASIFGELDSPNQVGAFEKTITLVGDHDDDISIKIQGKCVPVVVFTRANLVIKSKAEDEGSYVVKMRSPLGLDLAKFDWHASFETDCSVECKALGQNEFELNLKISHKDLSGQTVSSPLRLEASKKNSNIKIKEDLLFYFAFNSTTTPRRLALRKSGDFLRGNLIVHSPDLVEDVDASTVTLKLKISSKANGDSQPRTIVVFDCVAKKLKTSSYLLNVQIDPNQLGNYDGFDSWVLTLDQGREWFAVPVLLE